LDRAEKGDSQARQRRLICYIACTMTKKKTLPIVVMLGAAGSGKGTQAALLEQHYGYKRVEAGAVVRMRAKEDSDLGRSLKAITESGGHAPEHLMTELLVAHVQKIPNDAPLLMDGYPRSMGQVADFEKLMSMTGRKMEDVKVVWLNISLEEAKRRLMNRSQCVDCRYIYENRDMQKCPRCGGRVDVRRDDNPEAIARRLAYFTAQTTDVLNRYRVQGRLVEINGGQEQDQVFADIKAALSLS
jgi:adenylate kinase